MTEAAPPPEAPSAPQTPQTPSAQGNGIATAGMVVGIVAAVIAWFPCLPVVGLIAGVIGLILSVMGLKKAGVVGSGKGKAMAGLICSILGCIGGTIILVLWIGAAAASKTVIEKAIEMYGNGSPPAMD